MRVLSAYNSVLIDQPLKLKMGSSESKEEEINIEEKTIDSMGLVNNNIVVQTARDAHHNVGLNEKMLIATYLLMLAEIIKLGIYMYTQCRKMMKKKYEKTNA